MKMFVYALLLMSLAPTTLWAVDSVDELQDLTGGLIPLLDYGTGEEGGGELFSGGHLSSRGYVSYRIRVKNQSGDPVEGDSLVVVVQKIQEMARLRDVTAELDLPGADGETQEGKPYFRVPVGDEAELAPYGTSEAIRIEISNPNLFRLYPPVLRVRGIRLTPAQVHHDTLKALIKEGILSEELLQGQGLDNP